MRRRLMTVLLALACGLLAIAPASAHKPSDSYLVLDVQNGVISGQWDIALRDLDHAIGLDGDDDGALTWREVRGRSDAIDAFALSRLRISRGDALCDISRCFAPDRRTQRRRPRRPALHRGMREHVWPGEDRLFPVLRPRSTASGSAQAGRRGSHRHGDFQPVAAHHRVGCGNRFARRQLVDYVEEGVWHIWVGLILFLLTLLLPSVLLRDGSGWRPVARFRQAFVQVLKVVTAFTVAHSLTLSLAVLGLVAPPSRLVESLIAFSVMIAAANNVVPVVTRYLWGVAFGFGLIHGFGFASVLVDLGLPRSALALALFGFNLGVELGQLALVAAFLPFAFLLRRTGGYRRWLMPAGSLAVAGIATLWLVERSLDVRLPWV
jgi:HupE / UreJ protein